MAHRLGDDESPTALIAAMWNQSDAIMRSDHGEAIERYRRNMIQVLQEANTTQLRRFAAWVFDSGL